MEATAATVDDAAPPPRCSTEPQFHLSKGEQPPSKSNSNTFCKALIVVILLLVIPLFPSQAPDFITQTVFTEFWEILHLLFIGIAVSYGMFCRKSDQLIDPDRIVHSRTDESQAYLSGISHLSSIFEDRFENNCALDEHDSMHIHGNCGCPLRSGGKCLVHGGSNFRAFTSNDANEVTFGSNGETVNQIFSSKYMKSESLVVVSNGKYFVGESSDFKPLNLPVRSLRSPIVDSKIVETNCSPVVDSKSSEEEEEEEDPKVVKIRGVVPTNLEKKFDQVVGLPSSPIPWRSNSSRVETREDQNNPKARAHSRPRSVGEVEFENFKSRSYLVPKFSTSPELVSSNLESSEKKKVSPVSRSKVAPLNGEALFTGAKSREEDKVGKGKQEFESLESEMVGKVLLRPKSVRTIKPRRYTAADDMGHRQGRIRDKFEADTFVTRDELESGHGEFQKEASTGNGRVVTDSEDVVGSEIDKDVSRSPVDVDSEVDRKAGEFIAKFREQIRLQKISAAKG